MNSYTFEGQGSSELAGVPGFAVKPPSKSAWTGMRYDDLGAVFVRNNQDGTSTIAVQDRERREIERVTVEGENVFIDPEPFSDELLVRAWYGPDKTPVVWSNGGAWLHVS